ncbi:hypothetical protein HZA75_02935 [Candidatus Roizmanbacteria bacterium]|nr:hypothetical protein [Candidatus Roizmanbacteria bacterium]
MAAKETRPPLGGSLNTNYVVQNPDLGTLLLRVPRRNKDIEAAIASQFGRLGYKGKFRMRSPEEQYSFSQRAFEVGLRVVPAVDIVGRDTYYPFIDGAKTIGEFFVSTADNEQALIVNQLFDDLGKAHNNGFVYGDRVIPNMLVHPQHGLTHIDFDVELSGQTAKEMDVSNAIYSLIVAGGEQTPALLATILATKPLWFDMKIVEYYLRRFSISSQETKEGDFGLAVDAFIAAHDVLRTVNKRV